MAATTMRLCGNTQSGESVKANEIHNARINLNKTSSYWDLQGIAATVDLVAFTADRILEAVAQPDRKPKDLSGNEIEPWTVEKELETLYEDLLIIDRVVTEDIKEGLPSDGIVKVHGREINLHQLTSLMRLQMRCIAVYAMEYYIRY